MGDWAQAEDGGEGGEEKEEEEESRKGGGVCLYIEVCVYTDTYTTKEYVSLIDRRPAASRVRDRHAQTPKT